ncbi:serine/threonine-protein kinase Chk2-like isoform X3 [Liolophura sinensis]|uniref:serine/threonine-protein kinase Chk2-like isoform X3 n=1 Tax=Liolophura sinensis TaxID=3198878 RepID=UPI0031582C0F
MQSVASAEFRLTDHLSTTNSYSSSQGTASSMETLPTQDLLDGDYSEEDSEETTSDHIWGRFFPLGTSFTAIDLTKDEYTFGRGESCDYAFNTPDMKKHQCFQAYSKIHFKLKRQSTSSGIHIFLEDCSSNGTFINGEKVGKGNKQVLSNNDEIALAMKKNKAFVFLDMKANDDANLPKEIREKYTLTAVLGRVEGGELFDRVINAGKIEEPVSKLLFYQMVCAVKYLHDKGITHRDLKPENILLAGDEDRTLIKVTDFGLSKFVDANTMMKTFCGTPTYLAPEILETAGVGSYTKAIDCWSLGVILFICLVGYPPFSDERKDMDLPKQILGGHFSFPEEYWKDISNEAIDLVKQLLVTDPKKRLTLQEALLHPWFKDEDMKICAKALMYPLAEGMVPPGVENGADAGPAPKKRPREGGEEPVAKRKGSEDTITPPETPSP